MSVIVPLITYTTLTYVRHSSITFHVPEDSGKVGFLLFPTGFKNALDLLPPATPSICSNCTYS